MRQDFTLDVCRKMIVIPSGDPADRRQKNEGRTLYDRFCEVVTERILSAIIGDELRKQLLKDDIVGRSVDRSPVLLMGETGVGKSLAARAIARIYLLAESLRLQNPQWL